MKDDIVSMLAGERSKVDPKGFKNDLTAINSRDDVLTVLIHLGYLSYDRRTKECYIPNLEVMGEMENAIFRFSFKILSESLGGSFFLFVTLHRRLLAPKRKIVTKHAPFRNVWNIQAT